MSTIQWAVANSGSWTTPANWSSALIPGPSDDALISLAGAYVVSVGTVTVGRVTLDDTVGEIMSNGQFAISNGITISAGTLLVSSGTVVTNGLSNTGTIVDNGWLDIKGSYDAGSLGRIGGSTGILQLDGTLDNAGGTFNGRSVGNLDIVSLGTIQGGTVAGLTQSGDSTLSGVAWQGTLSTAGRRVVVENGLSVTGADGSSPGIVDNIAGVVEFRGDQTFNDATITGQGSIVADNNVKFGSKAEVLLLQSDFLSLAIAGAGTIDSGGTINVPGMPSSRADPGRDAIISVADFENSGTVETTGGPSPNLDNFIDISSPIFANLSGGILAAIGGSIYVSPTTDFANNGIVAANGGAIVLAPILSGSGAVTLQNSGTVEVGSASPNSEIFDFLGTGTLEVDQPTFFDSRIDGFSVGDTITLGIPATAIGYTSGNLEMQTGGGQIFGLAITGDQSLSDFIVNTGTAGTVITICFLVGTRILTPAGERPVQDLAIGDLIVTQSGKVRPIVWVGIGTVLATRGQRSAATPVIVRKGALAANVPNRDLRITKGHSLYLDNALIPVEFLVNHRSIMWDDRAQELRIYHVELETHDVLVANGAPAESYRDDGNRWLFRNANAGWDGSAKESYAPILTGGATVDAAWRRLLERAGPRPGVPLTDDPGLHLLVDGRRVNAVSRHGEAHRFLFGPPSTPVRIISHAAAPQELGLARDPRVLGVALRRIVLRRGRRIGVIEAADERLTEGFHAFEAADGLRWTGGDAGLPTCLFEGFAGSIELVLQLGATTRYLHDRTTTNAAA